MAVNFKNILQTLKNGIVDIAEKDLKDFVADATADGQEMLSELKDDLKDWTKQFVAGELKEDELADLVKGQVDLLKLVALKEAGLAEIKVDQFKSDVTDLIISTITGLIP
ncbi:MAG: hypothetical protein AAGC65_00725 [Mucilaginibacter sp.]|uniref:hypothetical protein n=1 Tax=Mucilaginibacter sp. TaxID=1882438 RepID=UPI0031AF0613